MGFFDSLSCLKIVLPVIFFLLPTALRLFTVTKPSIVSSTLLAIKNASPSPLILKTRHDEDLAPLALLVPQNSPSPSSSVTRRGKPERRRRTAGAVEVGLSRARAAIREARNGTLPTAIIDDYRREIWLPRIYRNPTAFFRSYTEMERRLKVYVYEEGESPLVHDGPCKSIYSIEGRFIQEVEMMEGGLRTKYPGHAHLFFLPFSVAWMVEYLYDAGTHNHLDIRRFVTDYVDIVASRHPYWNRTAGADHFMLSCHDWGPSASSGNPDLFNNSIRALCNANTSEGFRPHKDVSIPEIHLLTGDIPPQVRHPPPPSTYRPILAFFAGGLHGPIRPVLLRHWENSTDPELQVHRYLPPNVNYFTDFMLKSIKAQPKRLPFATPRK